jgi:hypothetical protein
LEWNKIVVEDIYKCNSTFAMHNNLWLSRLNVPMNWIPITKRIPHSMVAFIVINHHMAIIRIQMGKK